jgi:hypothetical protein
MFLGFCELELDGSGDISVIVTSFPMPLWWGHLHPSWIYAFSAGASPIPLITRAIISSAAASLFMAVGHNLIPSPATSPHLIMYGEIVGATRR